MHISNQKLLEWGWKPFWDYHYHPDEYPGCHPARVIRGIRNHYLIRTENGEQPAVLSGKFRHAATASSDTPVVGDWVVILPGGPSGKAVIQNLLPRRSKFSRNAAGRSIQEQIIAANIDTVFIVSGLDQNYNLRRIERTLTLAWESGASPVILLNKTDLCPDVMQVRKEVESTAPGVEIFAISARDRTGIDAFSPYLAAGETVALIGSSGVGKSTLINTLLGSERQQVGAVRVKDGRGRHITSVRELLMLPEGGMIIDTPGLRELQLWSEGPGLETAFQDIRQLGVSCRFKDCSHTDEPGCEVLKAAADGRLSPDRLASYQKLLKERSYHLTKVSRSARQSRKAQYKRMMKQTHIIRRVKEKS